MREGKKGGKEERQESRREGRQESRREGRQAGRAGEREGKREWVDGVEEKEKEIHCITSLIDLPEHMLHSFLYRKVVGKICVERSSFISTLVQAF